MTGPQHQGTETTKNSLTPVERGGSKSLFDDVTGQQEGGACGTHQHKLVFSGFRQTRKLHMELRLVAGEGADGRPHRWPGARAAAPG